MAVHVPLSLEAQLEARVLMMSTNNILSPANGKPIIVPSQDIVLGLYYLSMERAEKLGRIVSIETRDALDAAIDHDDIVVCNAEQRVVDPTTVDRDALLGGLQDGSYVAHQVPRFSSIGEIEAALASGSIGMHTRIKSRFKTVDASNQPIVRRVTATPGRMLLAQVLPKHPAITFELVNQMLTKKEVTNVLDTVYRHCGQKESVIFADQMMSLGFNYACRAGISFGKDDMVIPDAKAGLVAKLRNSSRNMRINILKD